MRVIGVFLGLTLFVFGIVPVQAQAATPEPVVCPLTEPFVPGTLATGDISSSWGVDETALPGIPPIEAVWSSPDGELFVIAAKDEATLTPELYRYNPQSGELVSVLPPETLQALRTEEFVGGVSLGSPTFIPGTHTLLFHTVVTPNTEGIYFEIPMDLWSLDADTGTLTQILEYGTGGEFKVSPNGEHVVLLTTNSIRVVNPDGSNMRTIYDGRGGLGAGESISWADIVWIGDETFRALLLDAPLDAEDGGMGDYPLNVVEFDLNIDPVTPQVVMTVNGANYFNAYLSPTGDTVAYRTLNGNGQNGYDLVIARLGEELFTFASGDLYELHGWQSTQHVQWYDLSTETFYIADICGLSLPMS